MIKGRKTDFLFFLKRTTFFFALLVLVSLSFCFSGSFFSKAVQAGEFRRDPAIGASLLEKAPPEKEKEQNTTRIILKRDIEGRYAWVVEGPDVWRIMRADAELRRYTGKLKQSKLKQGKLEKAKK